MTYRVATSTEPKPAHFAMARRHADLSDALANMGTGVVLDDDRRLVAFHESQLDLIVRRTDLAAANPTT